MNQDGGSLLCGRAPQLAEVGEEGQEGWLNLELKLIADVGIIGVPNAGKSTLLSAISAGLCAQLHHGAALRVKTLGQLCLIVL